MYLEVAFRQHKTRLLEAKTGQLLAMRAREINNQIHSHHVDIYVSARLLGIAIPDPARDEMLLSVRLISGADMDDLLWFLVQGSLLSPDEVNEVKARWVSSDTSIGRTEGEVKALENVLGITVVGATGESIGAIKYNIGMQSGRVWRTYDGTITIQATPDLTHFPCDETLFTVSLRTRENFDPSECFLIADEYAPIPVLGDETHPPRGFSVIEAECSPLMSVCFSPRPDELIESELRFSFALRRHPEALIWRILIPAYLILLVGFAATAFALAFQVTHIEVMTQVLPALFIAAVALQLTAAQQVPVRSGATLMDRFFVASYLSLLLLYLSLEAQRFQVHWLLYLVAVVLLGIVSWSWRDLFKRSG